MYKGPYATKLYGEEGKNGVIFITTSNFDEEREKAAEKFGSSLIVKFLKTPVIIEAVIHLIQKSLRALEAKYLLIKI